MGFEKKMKRFLEEERKREGKELTRELTKTQEQRQREREMRRLYGGWETCPVCDGRGLEDDPEAVQWGRDEPPCSCCDGTGTVFVDPDGGMDISPEDKP